MQKKKARKGFLFLRRESVLPPYKVRRSYGRTESSAPTHLVIASQSAPRSKCPWGTDWRGNPFPHKEKDGFPRQ